MPVSGGNALLRDTAIGYLDTHFGRKDLPISDLVAAILSEQHGSDYPDLSKVARLLSLHPRSLQRSLSAEGTTFIGVVDRVRRGQAFDLITTTDLSFSHIAARLGMHEQASLTRAVRRWFDTSPSVRRTGQEPKSHSVLIDS
ncbi:helix-turn-helix transcriptional regulator [Streptomyces sp. NPDC050121]|uniref:helix-turn-helix transcriptional regulator n=1 Tax=Streptomyces sp. NPDC050121 TaxID=3365601 RepID=UPI0037A48E7E